MFALSDEIAIDPEVIERWRSSRRPPRDRSNVTELPAPASPDDTGERDRPADVIQLWGRSDRDVDDDQPDDQADELEDELDDELDEIGRLLAAPGGTAPPELPVPERLEHPPTANRMLGEVLGDALDHLMIQWE